MKGLTKIFALGQGENFVNIFVNSLKKDYVENGKVEFSSTVKRFYDKFPLTAKDLQGKDFA